MLEKLCHHDQALQVLCQPRVLAHLVTVLRENRIQGETGA